MTICLACQRCHQCVYHLLRWPVCVCVCVCVYQCWVTQSQDLSSPYKIFTRPALATVSGDGGRLNIENRHFILNWSEGLDRWHCVTTANVGGPEGNGEKLTEVGLFGRDFGLSGTIVSTVQSACWFNELSFTYSSLRWGRLSKRWLSMVVSLLWPRFLKKKKEEKNEGWCFQI